MENQRSDSIFHLKALDGLRGLLALYVLLHHTSSNRLGLQGSVVGQPFRFGLEAVLLFFLLSGFVISYSQESRGSSSICWRRYLLSRARRIYPIFLISLVLAYFVNCLASGGFHVPDVANLVGNLAMLQDVSNKPGIWFLPFEGNFPLWSLAYEVFFYLAYMAVSICVPRRVQSFVVGVAGAIGILINHFIPNHICNCLSFLPIWWCGVLMSRQVISKGGFSPRIQVLGIMMLLPGLVYYLWVMFNLKSQGVHLPLSEYPVFQVRFFGESLVLMAILPLVVKFRILISFLESRAVLWLGSISYALYALHFPILCGLPDIDSIGTAATILIKFLVIFVISWIAERLIQPWVNRKTGSWLVGNRSINGLADGG